MKATHWTFAATLMLIALMAFTSGAARGFHHASRDYHAQSKAAQWINAEWYDGTGGKAVWNQSYPFTADFTHTMMHVQVLCLAFAGALFFSRSMFWQGENFTVHAWRRFRYDAAKNIAFMAMRVCFVWFVWFMEGRGFTLLYHVILPTGNVPSYSFGQWLISSFMF